MTHAAPEEEPRPWQATVFLAYAHEDREVATAVKGAIETCASSKNGGGNVDVDKWEVGAELTNSILGSLQSRMRATDFGVFIYSSIGGKARDNVVFETGLCIGMKSTARTVLLLPKNADVTPSDLRGIIGIEYPYEELQNIPYDRRVNKLDGVGELIVDQICRVMAETPQNQGQPETGQPRSGTTTGQPSAALEMFNAGWTAEAALGGLNSLKGDVFPGKFVVHATRGIGQVVGFDPEDVEPRYVDVRFGSVTGRFRTTDLFEPPIVFQQRAGA
jgi:hypothetical protein